MKKRLFEDLIIGQSFSVGNKHFAFNNGGHFTIFDNTEVYEGTYNIVERPDGHYVVTSPIIENFPKGLLITIMFGNKEDAIFVN